MFATPVRILIVGLIGPHLQALLDRLAREGWGWYSVESQSEARIVLGTVQLDVVLACEQLIDGAGYDLSRVIGHRPSTLFVDIAVSEGHLWLPVVERGRRVLGERALDPVMLEWEVRSLLSSRSTSKSVSGTADGAPSNSVLALESEQAREAEIPTHGSSLDRREAMDPGRAGVANPIENRAVFASHDAAVILTAVNKA